MTIDSKYSRTVDFWNAIMAVMRRWPLLRPNLEHREERFLRDLDAADALHPLLAFLLLLEQLALAR